MLETGKLQVMQTLVGTTEHSGLGPQASSGPSPAAMYSVYKRSGRNSHDYLAIAAASASNISSEKHNSGPKQEYEEPFTSRPSPSRSPSNLSSTVGAAVHRILPHDESFNRILGANDTQRSSTEEERPGRSQRSFDMDDSQDKSPDHKAS
jgi:hypothetical protein